MIHPRTAASLGIEDNSRVRIETRHGSMIQTARITDRIRKDVVLADYGWWFPETGPRALYNWDLANYNLLTTASRRGSAFGTPNLKGVNCRISPAGPDKKPADREKVQAGKGS
jgi:anaerobic selenocysteine-containing dehydrogenase